MSSAELLVVCRTLGLRPRELAKSLAVAPATVERWLAGANEPTGLHRDVLRALHSVALHIAADPAACARVGSLLQLGLGALISNLLSRPLNQDPAP